MESVQKCNYLIIGGGIMGLTIARELRAKHPTASITLIEKEDHVAEHASGRNSGVLHAGFYYSPESLKAKFCRDGNKAMREFVKEKGLRINECGKVVVAKNEEELTRLHALYERGKINGVKLELVDEARLAEIEPTAKTYKQAIYSPTTAVVDPIEVCNAMRKELEENGVKILTKMPYQENLGDNVIKAGGQILKADHIINCAGAFADKVAKDFGFCQKYSIVPYAGLYLTYKGKGKAPSCCVYGVPNPNNPFLGVHSSVTVDGEVKIGPTATPVFGPENYKGIKDIASWPNAAVIAWRNLRMCAKDPNIRGHALKETRKRSASYMASQARLMFQRDALKGKFAPRENPGIRAQLMDNDTHELLHDFVVEGDVNTTHVLNAVSPAFTSSIPFAKHIVDVYVDKDKAVDEVAHTEDTVPAYSHVAALDNTQGASVVR